jgi:hypothetical protein
MGLLARLPPGSVVAVHYDGECEACRSIEQAEAVLRSASRSVPAKGQAGRRAPLTLAGDS